jgi:carboxylesterase type B
MRFLQLMRSLSIITLVGASAIVDCAKRAGPISTSSGLVVGAPITAAVTRYTVGYALPPTGSRRYKDPVRLTGIGPIDGTTTKPSCPQDGALTRSTT